MKSTHQRGRVLAMSAVILASVSAAPRHDANAQAPRAVIEFDHGAGAWRLITATSRGADTTQWTTGRTVTLTRDAAIDVRIVNTNTAVYRLSRDTSTVAAPERDIVHGFMSRVGPYFPELGLAFAGPARTRGTEDTVETTRRFLPRISSGDASPSALAVLAAGTRTEDALQRLDAAVYGPAGVESQLIATLASLERMRLGAPPEAVALGLRETLGVAAPGCASPTALHLSTPQTVLEALTSLTRAANELSVALSSPSPQEQARWAPLRDSATVLSARARVAVADFDTLLTNTYRVERLARIVATACSSTSAGVLAPNGALRTLSIRMEPRPEPEMARLADRGSSVFTVTVRPPSRLRPSLGVSGLVVPAARYATYATRPAGTQVEVYETGVKDQRFAWGVNLGFTWPRLDWRQANGPAVWLPELTLGNSGETKLVGVGTAISVSFLKLGAGVLWMRHAELQGSRPGQTLPNATYLRTGDTYGRRALYLSLSVFDLLPAAK